MIKVVPVESKKQEKIFIRFPWKIYKNDPHWVPPLIKDMKDMLSPKHPFYEYGKLQLFLAYKGDEVVGRIGASLNSLYDEHHGAGTGFFGFFESIDDQEVANALLDAAMDWLRKNKQTKVQGPASPSSTYEFGLLVEGFDDSPRIMMVHNAPYYQKLIENYGLEKAEGLYAYKMTPDKIFANEKLKRGVNIAKKRYDIEIRPINMKKMTEEVDKIKKIYNEAWEVNWGHVPFTDKEIDMIAEGIKPVADPELIPFVYVKGELAGMAVAVRDVNHIIKELDGKLFPFGFLKLLSKKRRSKIPWMRVILLGLLPKYRGKGIDAVIYYHLIEESLKMGLKYGEASWILESNPMMNRGMRVVSGEVYKRYNVYEMDL